MAIRHFEYRFAFLSNHYPCTIEIDGYRYETAVNAYWGLFYPDAAEQISRMPYYEARRYGNNRIAEEFKMNRNPALVKNEEARLNLMRRVLRVKFSNPSLRKQLLNTGRKLLINSVTYKEPFWAEYYKDSVRYGENWIGKLLMELRSELREEETA